MQRKSNYVEIYTSISLCALRVEKSTFLNEQIDVRMKGLFSCHSSQCLLLLLFTPKYVVLM